MATSVLAWRIPGTGEPGIKVKVKSLSRVRPSATPWTAAYQAPPSMGFSGQKYWSGVPLPSPHEVPRVVKFIDTASRTVVARAWGVSVY